MFDDYSEKDLYASAFELDGYSLNRVRATEKWGLFKSYKDDNGELKFYLVDDDWGEGNCDDKGLFQDRVIKAQEEAAYLFAQAKAEFGF